MGQNKTFLEIAEALKPVLHEQEAAPVPCSWGGLSRGDTALFDLGNHHVGYLTLHLGFSGSHPDAPAWLRVRFAEHLRDLEERVEDYNGWISRGWIQEEAIHVDVLPAVIELPRRYACRYIQVEVLDVSSKYRLTIPSVSFRSVTSADDNRLMALNSGDDFLDRLDAVACRTLRGCMHEVFEDGPKRDRRLWLGDLRLQALACYGTYGGQDLVKRCLHLFAGSTLEGGRVGACLFIQPEVEVDDTVMFDYSLLFIPTLLDYWKATGDMETLRALWPTALRQIELSQERFDETGLVQDSDVLGWCYTDWNLALNKQASAQGCYLYCVKAGIEIADALGEQETKMRLSEDYCAKKAAARQLWSEKQGFFTSGADKQVSWASQVWMVLGGAAGPEEGAALLERLETASHAEKMVTPYMYHNYVDALLAVDRQEKALEVLRSYWGGMLEAGADTFWELYNPENPDESPYGGTIVNSYCHAWSCARAYFLRQKSKRPI